MELATLFKVYTLQYLSGCLKSDKNRNRKQLKQLIACHITGIVCYRIGKLTLDWLFFILCVYFQIRIHRVLVALGLQKSTICRPQY